MSAETDQMPRMYLDNYAEEWLSEAQTKILALENAMARLKPLRERARQALEVLDQEKDFIERLLKELKAQSELLTAVMNRKPPWEIPF